MSKISERDLQDGLRTRRRPAEIAAEVRASIVGKMHADALRIPMDRIQASPYQKRAHDPQALEDLMNSISDTNGLISPIVVRPSGAENYEIVAGHTRYEACVRLGYADIPAVVRPLTDAEAARALVADNLARKDLSDYEIFKQLKELLELGYVKSNSEAARLFGRTRQDIIRYLCFGQLPAAVLELLEKHRSLLGASTAQAIVDFPAEYVVEGCHLLANAKLRTQQALIGWLQRQAEEAPIRNERRVLDSGGKTVGRVSLGASALKVSVRGVDYDKLSAVMQAELERQGFRF